jgi:hypothetical protein
MPTSYEAAQGPSLSEETPGIAPATPSSPSLPSLPPPFAGLHHEVTFTGKVVLSIDGLGQSASGGIIQVLKPAGATVLAAYAAAASTGFQGRTLANGDVTINGTGVTWSEIGASSIGSSNAWGEVTSIVKPIVDAAPAGLVNLTIGEVSSGGIDGEVIAVVFSDATQVRNNTVVLLFGAQNIAGDDFSITLANPLDKSDLALQMDMSLGISFSFQPSGQVSTVDVNGTRMSSSAGGQDDGEAANGALLTVGGIGDTNANPPPLASDAGGPRTDDELYNILPFVPNGATNITVHTQNPSSDDNIFFAAFFMNVAGNVNCESTPPTVAVTGVTAGPPKQIQITAQDAGSGMQSIVVNTTTNAVTVVPVFSPGTTSPIVITSTKVDQSSSAVIGLTATDACGNSTIFDPLDVSLGAAKGIQSLTETSRSFTATGISDTEHFVMIQNGNPGLKSVLVTVNGKKFEINGLQNNELRKGIDIGSAMVHGQPNTVVFRSKGKLGAQGIAVLYE